MSGVVCAGKKIHEILIEQGNFGTDNIVSRYIDECQLMSDLRHPHLVQGGEGSRGEGREGGEKGREGKEGREGRREGRGRQGEGREGG